MSAAVLLSSATQDWRTPPEVLEVVREAFGGAIDLDPCGGEGSRVGAKRELRYPMGLTEEWTGRVFVNCPYGREIEQWVERCSTAARMVNAQVIALVPARVGTGWWQRHVTRTAPARGQRAAAVCFWRGRIRFLRPDGSRLVGATFDSALVYWGERPHRFLDATRGHGWCVAL